MIGISYKMDRLIFAIAKHEGWAPVGSSSSKLGSRAYRNHNPGNLRASPFAYAIVDNFAVFKNDLIGLIALQWDIMQKAKGQTVTGLTGKSTIEQLMHKYAPSADNNDTEAYIAFVEKESGLPRATLLEELLTD